MPAGLPVNSRTFCFRVLFCCYRVESPEKMSYLHGHDLHQDGEVGQVVTQTHRVVHAATRTDTALVGPHSLL